jgi:catechol 2,3-dioxygenase-like lactoylglutathione lyase family enzyme
MLFIGDIHIYVSDFTLALRFWADGLGLEVSEKEIGHYSAYARLDFPEGGSSIRLMGPVEPWDPDQQPSPGIYPDVRFDITTSEFDAILVRLMENGGRQVDEIETYNKLRMVTIADPDGNLFELLEIEDDAVTESGECPA